MIENLIDKHLKKQGFIRVPASWSDDYKRLVEKHSAVSKVVRELGREYNEILRVIGFNDGKNSEIAFDSLNEVIRNCIPYREGYELGKHLREDIDYQNMTSKGMRR